MYALLSATCFQETEKISPELKNIEEKKIPPVPKQVWEKVDEKGLQPQPEDVPIPKKKAAEETNPAENEKRKRQTAMEDAVTLTT